MAQADSRDSETQGKVRELLDQMERLRDTLRSSQEATQAARDRIGFLESEAAAAKEAARVRYRFSQCGATFQVYSLVRFNF